MQTVYKITNTSNGKIYIGVTGQGISVRWGVHKLSAKKGLDTYFCRALRKHGFSSFTVEALCHTDAVGDALLLERYFIKEHNSCNPLFGYNSTLGGEGGSPNSEVRERISRSLRGRKRATPESEETRLKKSRANKGKFSGSKNPMYGKRGNKSPHFGIPRREETRKKISEAMSAYYKRKVRNTWISLTKYRS